MSKELDKFKKSYATLDKKAKAVSQDYAVHTTNREHHKNMLLESAKEIGRAVQKAKSGGAVGTDLKDFLKEKDVIVVMKTVLNANAALSKEEARLKGILKKTSGVVADLKKLDKEIDKEVTKREKKENRKLFAKDSKSLPVMKKLCTTVATEAVDVDSNIIAMENTVKWSAAVDKRNFEKWVKEEISKTKADQKERDNKENDGQAFDMRIVNKATNQVSNLQKVAVESCKSAVKCYKKGDRTGANDGLAKAHDALKAIKKIHVPYERKMKSMNKYDIMGMQQSKDGKKVLASIELMEKSTAQITKMIKTVARTTV